MSIPVVFWIDSANNKLAGGWNSFVYADKPTFKQGDEVDVTLRWIKRPVFASSSMEEVPFGSSTIDLEIGNRGWKPVAGKWYIQFNGDNTELLEHDIAAEDFENALNTVPSIVTAGGVSVTRINDDGYKVVYVEDGAQSAPVGFGEGLSPVSDVVINTVSSGSATTKAVFWIYLRQSIISETTSEWQTEDAVFADAQELKPDIWEIFLSGQPKDGSFLVSVNDEEPFSVSVFATENDVKEKLGVGWQVSRTGDYRWRLTKDDGSAFAVAVISSANIVSFSGKTAKVLVNSEMASEMLAGITEATTTLQVSVTSNGARETILQTPCMVVGNLSL